MYNDIKSAQGPAYLLGPASAIKIEVFIVDKTFKFHFSGIGRRLSLLNEPVSDKTRQAVMETFIQSELRNPVNLSKSDMPLLVGGGIRPRLRSFEIRLHLGSAARVPKCIEPSNLRDIAPMLDICVPSLYTLSYISLTPAQMCSSGTSGSSLY